MGNPDAITQVINATDSANSDHGPDIDGNDLCGDLQIEITPPDLDFLTFDQSSKTLRLFTTNTDHITEVNNPVIVTVKAKLIDYPDIPEEIQSFNINIFSDCQNASQVNILQPQSPLPLVQYVIGSEMTVYDLQTDPKTSFSVDSECGEIIFDA